MGKQIVVALFLAASLLQLGCAQWADRNLWIWQYAEDDTVTSLSELDLQTTHNHALTPQSIRTAILEVRTFDNTRRVAAIAVPLHVDEYSWWFDGDVFPVRTAPIIPAGNYVAAWIINGQRRSNVIHFTVDPNKDLTKLPRLRIVQLEPRTAGALPDIVAYVTRASQSDPAPGQLTVGAGILIIDGVAFPHAQMALEGNDEALRVGQTTSRMLAWETRPELTKPHTIAARILNSPLSSNPMAMLNPPPAESQDSVPIPLNTLTPLADAWDKSTSTLTPLSADK